MSSERIIQVDVGCWSECGKQEGDGWAVVWLEKGWKLESEHGSIRKRMDV